MEERYIKKILVANRGEIAIRIIRACKELDIKTVAIYSEEDRGCIHTKLADESICIGKASARESYLNIPNIISACQVLNVDAVHPGFGFLSENYKFARICEDLNIKYIGPRSNTIYEMGNKANAKIIMEENGINTIPGYHQNVSDVNEAINIAKQIGYPVLIKATYGGGGKGIRLAKNNEDLKKQFNIAKLEAKNCFDKDELYIEKFIESPKHIEFQILADEYGNVVHLGERDCSMQRNKQKVLEECPSVCLSKKLRYKIGQEAVKVAKAVGYENAGTIEFLIDKDNNYYFLEMNTRIQVEHAITEEVTGIDIVKEQIKIASRERLSFLQEDIVIKGHAIECRINVENPRENFKPCSGKIEKFIMPGGNGIRIDTSVYGECIISPYYDSMITKLIAYGKNRSEAVSRMKRALDEMIIEGVETNIHFQKWLINQKSFLDGNYSTEFLSKRW